MPEEQRTSWNRTAAIIMLLLAAMLLLFQFVTSAPQQRALRTVSAWAWSVRYQALPVEDAEELAALHIDADRSTVARCIACHGDKTDSELPVHLIHVTSEVLVNLACPDCHPDVEIGPRGATDAPNWVDVELCVACHSAFPGSLPGSHMCSEDFDHDCGECHVDDLAPKHEQPYLPTTVAASECTGCHGGRALPWTPEHGETGWLDKHGMEALDEGEDRCFACHDFGLKFCDECHAETPPSHEPADDWRIAHPDAAQADTRVCFTCHETTWCKECHVNHEDEWLENHAAFVEENGDSSCTECHSLNACSFCHTQTAAEQAAGTPPTSP